MDQFPKISIVTTNLNGGAFLERTIRSVLDQEYPNLEYVIIDGGSNDDSIEIIKRYEDKFHYWTSEKDDGMYDAIQKGFARTSGAIMAWLNSDDVLHPRALQRVAELFTTYPEIKWMTGTPSFIDEVDNVYVPFALEYPLWSKLRFYSFDYKWIQQESTFWRRDLWDRAGSSLNTSMSFAGDLELWLRFFRFEKLYCAPMLIGGFRMRRNGQKSIVNYRDYVKESNACIRKEWKRISILNLFLVPLSYVDRVLISIPLFRGAYHRTGVRKIFGYPPKLEFDQKLQKLIMR